MKHIEGTRTGDYVTGNVPIGSIVKDAFGWYSEQKVTDVTHTVDYQVIVGLSGMSGIVFMSGQRSRAWIVITPGRLPLHHRLWNWIACKINKDSK
jgi:hypothetical protein